MANRSPQLAPPKQITDPFPAQWLRSIQSAGHPIHEHLLGGTWNSKYISESWTIASDGILRNGGHSIEFGVRVGQKVTPLFKLPVLVQTCWPKVSIQILGKSSPDRTIRIIPPLFTNDSAADGLAIEVGAKDSGIVFKTRGLHASTGVLPSIGGWSVIPPSSGLQRIVFSRTKLPKRSSEQFSHAAACVKSLDESDLPAWLMSSIAPALQYSASRPVWVQALLGFPTLKTNATAIVMQQCTKVLAAGNERAIIDFFNSLDVHQSVLQPEMAAVLRWAIANHPASRLNAEEAGLQLAKSQLGMTPRTRALVFAVTRIALPEADASSSLSKDIRAGRFRADDGMAAALFAAGGDFDLASGAAFLVQPSNERQQELLTPCEWLALLYACPATLSLSGCLAIDKNPSAPFGVRSPIMSSTYSGLVTSRKEIEANRVRIAVSSGSLRLRSIRTWRTGTATSSALCIHLAKSGTSSSLNASTEVSDSTHITFAKSVHIASQESVVISTVGTA